MRKLKLFIATSIDGYIARVDGTLDWLDAIPNPDQLDYGYHAFYDTVDTLLIGRSTYEEVLGFGVEWPYADANTYVVSTQKVEIKTVNTFQLQGKLEDEVRSMLAQEGKDIWVVGGGVLISAMLDLGLIDEMLISVTPVILGDGIPLFPNQPKETRFELINSESFDTGFVNLSYKRLDT